jgi:glycosyltransferase involved in cell wall biosynthesis
MKVSIVSSELSQNCLGRAYLLGMVLKRKYDVEVLGSTFGDTVWKPCNTNEFSYVSVKGCQYPRYVTSIRELVRAISGEVIYAVKPRPTSFGVALLKALLNERPVVLDIDDDEKAWCARNWKNYFNLRYLKDPNSYPYTSLLERLIGRADHITVASTFFQSKYGGTLVPHARDVDFLDPDKYDAHRQSYKQTLDIDAGKVMMFLGTPVPHKGLEDLIQAMHILKQKDVTLVIVGASEQRNSYERTLQQMGRGKVKLFGEVYISEVPRYLTAADLVVLPQRRMSLGQVPAKVFDAMAMAKPIIATEVSDLSEILDGCGLLVKPGDVNGLAAKIDWAVSHEEEAAQMGRRAREKCKEKYSYEAVGTILGTVFSKYGP